MFDSDKFHQIKKWVFVCFVFVNFFLVVLGMVKRAQRATRDAQEAEYPCILCLGNT